MNNNLIVTKKLLSGRLLHWAFTVENFSFLSNNNKNTKVGIITEYLWAFYFPLCFKGLK